MYDVCHLNMYIQNAWNTPKRGLIDTDLSPVFLLVDRWFHVVPYLPSSECSDTPDDMSSSCARQAVM